MFPVSSIAQALQLLKQLKLIIPIMSVPLKLSSTIAGKFTKIILILSMKFVMLHGVLFVKLKLITILFLKNLLILLEQK